MDFRTFYDHLTVGVSRRHCVSLTATQGDNQSRGFYLTVKSGSPTVIAHFLLPTKEKKQINGVKEGDLYRVDIPKPYFDTAGLMMVEFELQGVGGQSFTDESIEYSIEPSIAMEE